MTPHRALVMIVGLALATVAEARLGETMPELVARFGETVGKNKVTLFVDGRQREVGEAFRFRVDDWAIDVVMIDGICARIRYAKSEPWTEDQLTEVLRKNAQELAWKEESTTEVRTWTRTDGAVANWDKARGLALELPLYAERTLSRKPTAEPGKKEPIKRTRG